MDYRTVTNLIDTYVNSGDLTLGEGKAVLAIWESNNDDPKFDFWSAIAALDSHADYDA